MKDATYLMDYIAKRNERKMDRIMFLAMLAMPMGMALGIGIKALWGI